MSKFVTLTFRDSSGSRTPVSIASDMVMAVVRDEENSVIVMKDDTMMPVYENFTEVMKKLMGWEDDDEG